MRQTRPLILAAFVMLWPLSAMAAPVSVPVDQVRKLNFAGLAASVSPGNPAIADVNVVDEQTILVVGRRPGVTNLIVLDRAGRTLFNDRIVVTGGDSSTVTISRGGKTSSYSCAPSCQQLDGAAPSTR